jgi:hypothetical protein
MKGKKRSWLPVTIACMFVSMAAGMMFGGNAPWIICYSNGHYDLVALTRLEHFLMQGTGIKDSDAFYHDNGSYILAGGD